MVFAVAALTLTGCDDVPMPYNQPDVTPGEPTVEVTPSGTGTAADPYNVAAILQRIQALSGDTTEVLYVKGAVKEIKQIETETYGNANYYITDDGSNQVYIFQSYYLGNRKFTANDKLEIGDTVVIRGRFVNYMGNTPETIGKGTSYIYSLNGQTSGDDTPTPTPTPGEATGYGTEANPYNAAGANAKARTLADGETLANVYVSGIVCKIRSFNSSYNNISYYISDDGTESSEQFYIYGGLGLNGSNFSSESDLKVGQKVVVVGTLINYMGNTPEFQHSSKIVSIDGSGNTPTTTPSNEPLSISGTTVTLTNTSATAGTETASIDFSAQGLDNAAEVTEFTLSDGTKITFDKGEGTNTPKYYNGTKGIRVYLNNIITFNGVKKIAKVVMTCDSYNSTDYVGNKGASVTFNGNDVVYTNSDASVTSGGGVQLRVKTITITYAQ